MSSLLVIFVRGGEARGEGEGGQREGTVEGKQYSTQVKKSSFFYRGNSSQAGSKIQTMSECIASL